MTPGLHLTLRSASIAFAFAIAAPSWASAAPTRAVPDVRVAAQAFLTAYAKGDRAQVMSVLTAGPIHVYGGDVAEAASDREGVARIFDGDQKLWGGGASFGAMTNVSTERSGGLATIFFDDTFHLGDRTFPIRFAMVWRLERGAWKLAQSSNVVPTVGQSAAQLLSAPR